MRRGKEQKIKNAVGDTKTVDKEWREEKKEKGGREGGKGKKWEEVIYTRALRHESTDGDRTHARWGCVVTLNRGVTSSPPPATVTPWARHVKAGVDSRPGKPETPACPSPLRLLPLRLLT